MLNSCSMNWLYQAIAVRGMYLWMVSLGTRAEFGSEIISWPSNMSSRHYTTVELGAILIFMPPIME